jgi:hypothetical protein
MAPHAVVSLLLASLVPASGAPQTSHCPPRDHDPAESARSATSKPQSFDAARVLVGVDVLGRVVVAVDSDRDGVANTYVKFTDEKRLEGPWSRLLERADVVTTRGTLRIQAHDESLGVALSVSGAETPRLWKPKRFRRTLVSSTGVEFIRTTDAKPAALSALDVNSVHTWPEGFWHDTLAPGTLSSVCNCDSAGCSSGGCGAAHCALSDVDRTGCEVQCASPRYFFACCTRRFLRTSECKCVRYNAACWF